MLQEIFIIFLGLLVVKLVELATKIFHSRGVGAGGNSMGVTVQNASSVAAQSLQEHT